MITLPAAEALPAVRLKAAGPITSAFAESGVSSFRDAARLIAALPYGRKFSPVGSSSRAPRQPRERQHKNSLLARLARETKADDRSLHRHLRDGWPQYARDRPCPGSARPCLHSSERIATSNADRQRIDVTSARADNTRRPIERFLVELAIAFEQAGSYKSQLHQEFMRSWMESASVSPIFSFDKLWAVREACIRVLEVQS